jgi:hypothetical protein
VSYAQAEASPDRAAYLTAREELIDSWNHAQRPIGAELAGEPEQTRPTIDTSSERTTAAAPQPAYDSGERRNKDTEALHKAGVDADAINAHRLTDLSNAKPATDIDFGKPSGAKASKGDRSGGKNISHDRGSR